MIQKVNHPSKMRRVLIPSVLQAEQVGRIATEPLPLVPADQERIMVERN